MGLTVVTDHQALTHLDGTAGFVPDTIEIGYGLGCYNQSTPSSSTIRAKPILSWMH